MRDVAITGIAAGLIVGLVWAGVYLIVTEHYGWAWIPLLYAGCVDVKQSMVRRIAPKQSQIVTATEFKKRA